MKTSLFIFFFLMSFQALSATPKVLQRNDLPYDVWNLIFKQLKKEDPRALFSLSSSCKRLQEYGEEFGILSGWTEIGSYEELAEELADQYRNKLIKKLKINPSLRGIHDPLLDDNEIDRILIYPAVATVDRLGLLDLRIEGPIHHEDQIFQYNQWLYDSSESGDIRILPAQSQGDHVQLLLVHGASHQEFIEINERREEFSNGSFSSEKVQVLNLPSPAWRIKLSPSGKYLAVVHRFGSTTLSVTLWETQSSQLLFQTYLRGRLNAEWKPSNSFSTPIGRFNPTPVLSFHSNESYFEVKTMQNLGFDTFNAISNLIHVTTGQPIRLPYESQIVTLSDDGEFMVAHALNEDILLQRQNQKFIVKKKFHVNQQTKVTLSPDGRTLVVAENNRHRISFLNPETLEPKDEDYLLKDNQKVSGVDFSPNSENLLIHLWHGNRPKEYARERLLIRQRPHRDIVWRSDQIQPSFWDRWTQTYPTYLEAQGRTEDTYRLQFNSTSTVLIKDDRYYVTEIWDAETGAVWNGPFDSDSKVVLHGDYLLGLNSGRVWDTRNKSVLGFIDPSPLNNDIGGGWIVRTFIELDDLEGATVPTIYVFAIDGEKVGFANAITGGIQYLPIDKSDFR